MALEWERYSGGDEFDIKPKQSASITSGDLQSRREQFCRSRDQHDCHHRGRAPHPGGISNDQKQRAGPVSSDGYLQRGCGGRGLWRFGELDASLHQFDGKRTAELPGFSSDQSSPALLSRDALAVTAVDTKCAFKCGATVRQNSPFRNIRFASRWPQGHDVSAWTIPGNER